MKLTYTDSRYFVGPLPKIPSSTAKQIELLEHAVADLIDMYMDLAGWDNDGSVIDLLADECISIVSRAYERSHQKRDQ